MPPAAPAPRNTSPDATRLAAPSTATASTPTSKAPKEPAPGLRDGHARSSSRSNKQLKTPAVYIVVVLSAVMFAVAVPFHSFRSDSTTEGEIADGDKAGHRGQSG